MVIKINDIKLIPRFLIDHEHSRIILEQKKQEMERKRKKNVSLKLSIS